MTQTIYLPATDTRPTEPAPYLMTEDEVIRLLRESSADPYQVLYRMRAKGELKSVRRRKTVLYPLPCVVEMIEKWIEDQSDEDETPKKEDDVVSKAVSKLAGKST